MPAAQYVLVADAARARLLSAKGGQNLQEIAAFEHPESRLQNREIQSDAYGRRNQSQPGGGPSNTTTEQTDPHRVEAEKFARQLADSLRDARLRGDFEELVIVAPPKFLGMLREALDTPTSRLLGTSVAKDFTHVPTHELEETLRSHLQGESLDPS